MTPIAASSVTAAADAPTLAEAPAAPARSRGRGRSRTERVAPAAPSPERIEVEGAEPPASRPVRDRRPPAQPRGVRTPDPVDPGGDRVVGFGSDVPAFLLRAAPIAAASEVAED